MLTNVKLADNRPVPDPSRKKQKGDAGGGQLSLAPGGGERGEKSLSREGRDFSAAIRGIAGVRLCSTGRRLGRRVPVAAAFRRKPPLKAFPETVFGILPPEPAPVRQKNTVTV